MAPRRGSAWGTGNGSETRRGDVTKKNRENDEPLGFLQENMVIFHVINMDLQLIYVSYVGFILDL